MSAQNRSAILIHPFSKYPNHMSTEPKELSPKFLTLWPKLKTSYRVLQRWVGRSGIIFISDDDQALITASAVGKALLGTTIELPSTGLKKSEFHSKVGKFLDGSMGVGEIQFAGMDKLCVIIPRIDEQPIWLRKGLKGICERRGHPVALLVTCPDLDWMPSSLKGHLGECRKKGASKQESISGGHGKIKRRLKNKRTKARKTRTLF
jgi:hypothetical protein